MDEPFVRVLVGAELAESTIRRVRVAAGELLVARLDDGQVVAFAATCPHQRTDLEGADIVDGLVRCPLHAYMYDPRTGENVEPTAHADPSELWKLKPGYLPVHPVEERNGAIWVARTPAPPPPSYDPAVELAPERTAAGVEPLPPPVHVRVPAGTTFELRLPTPGSMQPGFLWRVDTGTPLLTVVEARSVPGDDHLVRLVARTPGRFTVTCRYARPWDREPAQVRRYDIDVYS